MISLFVQRGRYKVGVKQEPLEAIAGRECLGGDVKWYGSDRSYKCPATLPVRCKARKGNPVIFA
jgi:hypothetical protein